MLNVLGARLKKKKEHSKPCPLPKMANINLLSFQVLIKMLSGLDPLWGVMQTPALLK